MAIFRRLILNITRLLSFAFLPLVLLSAAAAAHAQEDCYKILTELQFRRFAYNALGDRTPIVIHADGTKVPIARAFEKEGLLYSDIADWFPSVKPEAAEKMRKRLEEELSGAKPGTLRRWLKHYSKHYRAKGLREASPKKWEALSEKEQLEWLLSTPDFFVRINIRGREELIYDDVLKFDDLAVTPETPEGLVVGDDLGSYEVRSNGGVVDRSVYFGRRALVEQFLEGRVGHQHKVHQWPEDPVQRAMIAPFYIELLDGGTWYLYWRQMKRDPNEVESVLSHPFLGVYTRRGLNYLHAAVTTGTQAKFKNKFRMIGARAFKADPKIPEQGDGMVPDFELRSGNKGEARDFVEDMIEARIASGDYSGLRDFRDYVFDPSAPIDVHTYKWLKPVEIEVLKEFERLHPQMRYSRNPISHNHQRTKVLAPLFPWEARLHIPYKRAALSRAQRLYAEGLYKIAKKYVGRVRRFQRNHPRARNAPEIGEWRMEALEDIETLAYRFAKRARLDLDFERYLTPRPDAMPSLTVPVTGPIDVNELALGVEYSFRFPSEVRIDSREVAEREIQRTIMALRDEMGGGKIEQLSDGGHGHGASVRYRYTDPYGRVWRAEWDGIQRGYIDGQLVNPHGGHVEIPSPKYYPKDPKVDVQPVFDAARKSAQAPRRSAGGGHLNTDLEPLKRLDPRDGVRRVKNLIGYFESNQDMVTFLWQHPKRAHAARPVEYGPEFAERLAAFEGDWYEFGRFLYEERYFNPYVGRKPRYVPMDLTGIMADAVPATYRTGELDIKNPRQKWYPDFGKGKDRIEFRLYDAPVNEYFAALQIKYHRALLNRALNSPDPIPLRPNYESDAKDLWRGDAQEFVKAAEAHLRELGLDPNEYRPVIQQAWEVQQESPHPPKALKKYERFLPARAKIEGAWIIDMPPRCCGRLVA